MRIALINSNSLNFYRKLIKYYVLNVKYCGTDDCNIFASLQ